MKKKWLDLDHKTHLFLKENNLLSSPLLVCVSGGADSVALAVCLSQVMNPKLLTLFHYHHGEQSNSEFRNKALDFVKKLSLELKLDFEWAQAVGVRQSESELREARYKAIEKILAEKKIPYVTLGHHQLDLLETRLIRLIRGTGSGGIISMKKKNQNKLRPFLDVQPEVLREYLLQQKRAWLEDPSNDNPENLRNWIRQFWLPALEKQRSGSVRRLSQSLSLLAQLANEVESQCVLKSPQSNVCERSYYISLTNREQKQLLASWFLNLKIRQFTQAHIEEIHKQLDKRDNVIRLHVGPVQLDVNAQRIKVLSASVGLK